VTKRSLQIKLELIDNKLVFEIESNRESRMWGCILCWVAVRFIDGFERDWSEDEAASTSIVLPSIV
jgi:hypothetical protein